MNNLSLASLAAVAACSGVPVIQQSAPEVDPKTKTLLEEALTAAQSIRDKCIGLLQGGETYFHTSEAAGKFETNLGIKRSSSDGNTHTEETCDCVYRYDIPTNAYEKKSYRYSWYSYAEIDGTNEQVGIDTMSISDKSDGRSFASLRTNITDTARRPVHMSSSITTEMPKDGEGCKVGADDLGDVWDAMPYDPENLQSCYGFAGEISSLMRGITEAICAQLEQGGNTESLPPLCSGWTPARLLEPGTSNNR